MKTCAFVLLFIFCYSDCRKVYTPIDKNVNLAFINMEAGGVPANKPANARPTPVASPATTLPPKIVPTVPPAPTTSKAAPATKPTQPTPPPKQIKPVPVNPSPAANTITTPGPGSVKQLITFYDSQGKASLIRPYSYSQAVKQG